MSYEFYENYPYPMHGNHNDIFERKLGGFFGGLAPLRILDAGCGTGAISRSLAEHFPEATVVAVDQAKSAIEIARGRYMNRNLEFRVQNLENGPVPVDSKFDFVVCQGALHHMREPLKALENIYNSTTPDMIGYVWLYSWYGRLEISFLRRLLEEVSPRDSPTHERLSWLSQLRPSFRDLYVAEEEDLAAWTSDDPEWTVDNERAAREIDRYINPIARHYSVESANQLFRAAGFCFVSVPTLDEAPLADELRRRLRARLTDPVSWYGALEILTRPLGIGYMVRKQI